jgi:hypothetical protein
MNNSLVMLYVLEKNWICGIQPNIQHILSGLKPSYPSLQSDSSMSQIPVVISLWDFSPRHVRVQIISAAVESDSVGYGKREREFRPAGLFKLI